MNDKTPISVRPWEVAWTAWSWISEDSMGNKIIEVSLRGENNLIKINDNNEVYTDLQLDGGITPSSNFPVGVSAGRVLQANGRPVTWTVTISKTTSWDYTIYLYGDNGDIYIDNGTWTFTKNVQGAIVSADTPTAPIRWMLWYDTTSSKLKVYDGTQWNII